MFVRVHYDKNNRVLRSCGGDGEREKCGERREKRKNTSFSSQIVIGVHRPVSVVRIHRGDENLEVLMYLLGHHHGSLDDTEPERVSGDQVYVHLSEINGRVSIEDVGQTGSTLIWSEGGFTWPYHDRSKQERWEVGCGVTPDD